MIEKVRAALSPITCKNKYQPRLCHVLFPGLSMFGLYMSTLSFHRLVVIVCLFFSKSTLNFTKDGANILAY